MSTHPSSPGQDYCPCYSYVDGATDPDCPMHGIHGKSALRKLGKSPGQVAAEKLWTVAPAYWTEKDWPRTVTFGILAETVAEAVRTSPTAEALVSPHDSASLPAAGEECAACNGLRTALKVVKSFVMWRTSQGDKHGNHHISHDVVVQIHKVCDEVLAHNATLRRSQPEQVESEYPNRGRPLSRRSLSHPPRLPGRRECCAESEVKPKPSYATLQRKIRRLKANLSLFEFSAEIYYGALTIAIQERERIQSLLQAYKDRETDKAHRLIMANP